MKINLGVIYGGNSTEHEISIISAVQAMHHLDKEKYEIVPIYVSKDNKFYTNSNLMDISTYKDLKKLAVNATEVIFSHKNNENVLIKNKFPYGIVAKIDLILPIMHGYNTEDGSYAGFFEVLGIPFCQSDLYSSCIGQDKVFQKQILQANGINIVDYKYFYENEYDSDSKKVVKDLLSLGLPLIVKPSRQGSSVGISIANTKEELISAIEDALNYDDKILVEKVVEDLCELNISVLGDNSNYELSQIEEVFKADTILSYEDKYLGSGKSKGMASAGRKIPADITKAVEKRIEQMAIDASKALNISGVVRIDFMLDRKTKEIYLNEFNITPGSLAFYLWTGKEMNYSKLLDKIIDCGIKKYQAKSKKLTNFETNVLEGFNGAKGVKK